MNAITIKTVGGSDPAPMYDRGHNQFMPYDADIYLDARSGVLSAYFNPSGARTPDEVYGHVLLWSVRPEIHVDALNELLAEVAPYAQRIIDGHSENWNGSNFIAEYTDDARDAIDAVDDLCHAVYHSGRLEDLAIVIDDLDGIDFSDLDDEDYADMTPEDIAEEFCQELVDDFGGPHRVSVRIADDVARIIQERREEV